MPHKDPIVRKAWETAYYLKNRARILARVARRYEENHEAEKAKARARHAQRKDSVNAARRAERAENPEKFREQERIHYAKNIERKRETDRRRYRRDKEKIKRRARRYAKNNPDKRSDAQQRRRALKAGAIAEQVLRAEILRRDGPDCAICGIETVRPVHLRSAPNDRHYDHIIPLKRGGRHSMDNVRILCATCNLRKKQRLDSELPPSFGRAIGGEGHALQ
jgi:5-methylcytosine-specific restriction endonuclease McrA